MPLLNSRTPAYQPQPKYTSNYNGFAGGLNLFYTPTEIKTTELAQSDNCMLIGEGVITGRWGSRTYFTASSGNRVRMLAKYENLTTSANELLVFTDDGYLRKKSGVSATIIAGASFVSGATMNSTQIANYQYIVSSSNNFIRYNGTSLQPFVGISRPSLTSVVFASGVTGTATWSYKVTAFSIFGETLPSTAVTLSNMSFNRTLFRTNLTWVQPSTASGYITGFGIYVGLPGDETLIDTVGPQSTTYTDTGNEQSEVFPPTTDTTAGVKAKFIERFEDRLVIAGIDGDPTMIMISGKYPYQERFNWQNGGAFIRIAPDSGDEITGLRVIGQNATGAGTSPGILVFMKESVHLVTLSFTDLGGYIITTPVSQQLSPQGASSFRSVVNVQNSTFYFGRTGLNVVGYEQNFLSQIRTREVSARIRPYVQAVLPVDLPEVASAYIDYKYLMSFPSTKDTMVYDYERGAFIGPWKTPFGITQWIEYIDDAGDVYILAGCDDGVVRQFSADFHSDSGQAIVKTVKTKKDDFGNWSVLKTLELINMLFRNVSGTISVNIIYEKRDGTFSSVAKSFELQGDMGGTGWGTDLWGEHLWGQSNRQVVIPQPQDTIRWSSIYKTGRTIQVEIIQNGTEINFELADMKLSATLQPEGSLSSTLRI
jgi:hypothetical protein